MALAVALLVPSGALAASGWRVAKTLASGQSLVGVGVVPGTSQAWAVGSEPVPPPSEPGPADARVPFIMHLDGRWTEVPAPMPARDVHDTGDRYAVLRAVSARTASDVWAVRDVLSDNYAPRTLIEHWDGTSWQIVPSPNPTIYDGDGAALELDDVLALGADDAWAVGGVGDDGNEPWGHPVVMHWDGVSWSLVSSADLGDYDGWLHAIARVGQTLAGAGSISSQPGAGTLDAPLTERFKAGGWTRTPAPATSAYLMGATGIAWNDAWAVGGTRTAGSAVALHYDGIRWSLVPTPVLTGVYGPQLNAVSAVASNDVWAVGNGILHWDGTGWSLAQAPSGWWRDVSMRRNSGYGWAVGRSDAAQGDVILQHIPG